ncbi:MAG: putative ABC transporter permease [Candidatus Coprovivens sp.]
MGDKIKKYYLYFMMYAVLGWLYEDFLEVVVYRWGFTNRGVLFGPYCPVYGVGALAFIFILGWLLRNKDWKKKVLMIPIIFLGCMVIATLIELIASYLCEWIFGSWPWQTYVDYKINFEGRIALSPSIRFGLGGVLFLYIIQPLFEKVISKLSRKLLNVFFYVLLFVFLTDIIFKIIRIII